MRPIITPIPMPNSMVIMHKKTTHTGLTPSLSRPIDSPGLDRRGAPDATGSNIGMSLDGNVPPWPVIPGVNDPLGRTAAMDAVLLRLARVPPGPVVESSRPVGIRIKALGVCRSAAAAICATDGATLPPGVMLIGG